MERADVRIEAACTLFACRMCRTKTGWAHQRWCELSGLKSPTCRDCRYWSAQKAVCVHPAQRKGGDV